MLSKLKKIMAALLLCFVFTACGANAFSDVSSGEWFYENVSQMAEKGYLKGYPDGSFGPGLNISAAEFVSVVGRIYNIGERSSNVSHWAAGTMQAALESGWYDWDEISPSAENYDKPITRVVAVKIVMKAFMPEARGDYAVYSGRIADFNSISGRYYDSVLAAYSEGVAIGDENGNFNPNSYLTRAEACALITRSTGTFSLENNTQPPNMPAVPEPVVSSEKGVSSNGRLHVAGTSLCNERGEAVVLRGMSSHGIQWFPQFLTKNVISSTRDYGANLFRAAMYTDENGYISNRAVKDTLYKAVDTAISLDMYVIIDWHILHDGNPMTYKDEAAEFFRDAASRYKDSPAVLYEICNEPNGAVTWNNDVKPYAEYIISEIRAIDSDAVILVGSPTWSQDLHEAAKNPLSAENIMYTCHFYAGTHTAWLRDRITDVMRQGLPVFVTEWGTSDASGGGGVFTDEAAVWLEFLNKNNISWANWSLCDKNETSAAIAGGSDISDGISDAELTESGRFVFSHFND